MMNNHSKEKYLKKTEVLGGVDETPPVAQTPCTSMFQRGWRR
jgi:hypothetical protein